MDLTDVIIPILNPEFWIEICLSIFLFTKFIIIQEKKQQYHNNLTKSQGSKKFHCRLKSHVQIQNHQKDRTNLS